MNIVLIVDVILFLRFFAPLAEPREGNNQPFCPVGVVFEMNHAVLTNN
jgi:hypothetical protein